MACVWRVCCVCVACVWRVCAGRSVEHPAGGRARRGHGGVCVACVLRRIEEGGGSGRKRRRRREGAEEEAYRRRFAGASTRGCGSVAGASRWRKASRGRRGGVTAASRGRRGGVAVARWPGGLGRGGGAGGAVERGGGAAVRSSGAVARTIGNLVTELRGRGGPTCK